MSKRTFILSLDNKDNEHSSLNDIIDIIAIRIAQAYLEASPDNKIQVETLTCIKTFVSSKLLLTKGETTKYSVDIDFENDIKE